MTDTVVVNSDNNTVVVNPPETQDVTVNETVAQVNVTASEPVNLKVEPQEVAEVSVNPTGFPENYFLPIENFRSEFDPLVVRVDQLRTDHDALAEQLAVAESTMYNSLYSQFSTLFDDQNTTVLTHLQGQDTEILRLRDDLTLLVDEEGNRRQADFTEERTLRIDADSALAQSVTDLATRVDNEVAVITADYNEQITTLSNQTSALAQSVTSLNTAYDNEYTQVRSLIQQENTSRSSADEALAQSITNLAATVDTDLGNLSASVDQRFTTKTDEIEAVAQNVTTLESDYVALTDAVAQTNAAIVTESETRASEFAAQATLIEEIEASLTFDIGDASAAAQDYTDARVGYCVIGGEISNHTDKAACEAASGTWQRLPLATALEQVNISYTDDQGETQTGSASVLLESLHNELGDVQSRVFIGTDVNGRVTGIDIYSADGTKTTSDIDLIFDRLRMLNPDDLTESLFGFNTANNQAYFKGQLILGDGYVINGQNDIIAGDSTPGPKGDAGAGFWTIQNSSGNFPSDSAATSDFTSTFGRAPIAQDHLTYRNSAKTNSTIKRYNGSSWVAPTLVVGGDALVQGAVTSFSLATDAVDTEHLKAEAVKASKIDVGNLSAITATMGTVTSGTFQTASSGRRAIMSSGGLPFQMFDDNNNLTFSVGSQGIPYFAGGLAPNTIDDLSVFTEEVREQLLAQNTETTSTGGTESVKNVDVPVDPYQVDLPAIPSGANNTKIKFKFSDHKTLLNGETGDDPFWRIRVLRNGDEIYSEVHKGEHVDSSYNSADGFYEPGFYRIDADVEIMDTFNSEGNNVYSLHVNKTQGRKNNPTIVAFSASEPIESGAGNTLRGYLDLIGVDGRPALYIEGASSAEGDIAVADTDAMQLGHWDGNNFTTRLSISSTGVVDTWKQLVKDEIRFEGGRGENALIQRNAGGDRDELQIYACGDAYGNNSRGAGIHLYGNDDDQHAGNIAFLTGQDDHGDGRMIISGGSNRSNSDGYRTNNDTRVTIGNNIWNFVDNRQDTGMLNLYNPSNRPALFIQGASVSEGDIAVPYDEAIQLGHWNGSSFTQRFAIGSNGDTLVNYNLRLPESSTAIYTEGGKAVIGTHSEYYLHINGDNHWNNGVYFGNSPIRTDHSVHVGSNGTYFSASSSSTRVRGNTDLIVEGGGGIRVDNPTNQPAIYMSGANSSEGDLATDSSDALQIGHWNGSNFTSRITIDSAGDTIIYRRILGGGSWPPLDVESYNQIRTGANDRTLDLYRRTTVAGADILRIYSDEYGTASNVFAVEANGDIVSVTGSNSTESDRRLKTDIVDANSQWSDIKKIRFVNYKLIKHIEQKGDDATKMLGVIAQELEEAGMGNLVKEREGTGYKAVKYSIMTLKGLVALQEAMERIEQLEAQVASLTS